MTLWMHHKNSCIFTAILALSLVMVNTASAQTGSLGGVQASTVSGAYVQAVPADSAAARAGLRAGDLVLQLNGTAVTSVADVQRLLQSTKPGQTISLGVMRNGQATNLSVTLQASATPTPAPAPAAKPAAAPTPAAGTIATGLYLRTTYFAGSLSLNTMYFGPGNHVVIDPPHGVDPLDFAAAAKETPDKAGTYTVQGNNIRITWANGKTEQLPVEFEHGELSAYDGGLIVKADAYSTNQRLSGTYAWGATTANVSSSRTLKLSSDGTYTMTSLGGIHNTPGNSRTALGLETGTYTLGGNTLVLRATDGPTTTHTVMPFNTALDPTKAEMKDDHLIFDSISLVREQ